MAPEAFFLPAARGQRLCILHRPAAGQAVRGQLLYLHPWAEEMNKARRMAALQAAQLAQAGYQVLLIDLHGCGDSSDTWAEAHWDGWVDDAVMGARWLAAQAPAAGAGDPGTRPPLWLWGLRAGALLAAAAAARLAQPCHFLFWQPAPAGKPLLQQFLRLKGAASLQDEEATGGGAKAAIDAVRRGLAAGEVQHIAGYPLSPGLAQGLEAATLAPPAPPAAPAQVLWLEVSNRPEARLLPASAAAVQAWQAAGHQVHSQVVPGPAFWQTQEIEDAPALLAATLQALEAGSAAAAARLAGGAAVAAAGAAGAGAGPRSLAPSP